ncbi:MAG: dephospho-CoA kinase [Lachnospiraceae bacterium]|nr:dephospho-CoA kinase [Lachnospiraceae bacterium]
MVDHTKVIGITGGVGSGKSHVCKLIERHLGYPVIDSDSISKEQMEPGGTALKKVLETFGSQFANEDGTLNRSALADLVFNDPEKLKMLNAITHPAVIEEIKERIGEYAKKNIPFVFVESALACSAGYRSFCDELWAVTAPETVRRYRLMKGRGYTDEKIASLFSGQMPEEELKKLCDKEIVNGNLVGDLELCYQIETNLGL